MRYIDADKFILTLMRLNKESQSQIETLRYWAIVRLIQAEPTADVEEVKHGKWIRNERNIPKMREFHEKGIGLSMSEMSIFWTCSECGMWGHRIDKYCSECGAKMDGGRK